ncbi:type II secretion system F family protein [Vibrio rotiferianus]|uniref:type II secretion system F family protein n=1 Tax=Vibrio rotiferianus TaxID=190895 RepID=UPI0005ED4DFC|nr:type II secretion system F family protein [Vibrio rotiferianus]
MMKNERKGIVSNRDLPKFLSNLGNFIKSGIPTSGALKHVGNTFPQYRDACHQAATDCENGRDLPGAMKSVHLLSPNDIEIIRSGINSGCLEAVLMNMSEIKLEVNTFSQGIKKSLSMHLLTIVTALLVTPYILVLVGGQSQNEYLTGFNDVVEKLSNFIPHIGIIYPIALFTSIAWFFVSQTAQEAFFSTVSLIPYIRKALMNWQLSNWSSLMSMSLKAGLTFSQSETMLRETLSDALGSATKTLSEEMVSKGWEVACKQESWKEDDIRHDFPTLLIPYIEAGSLQGRLDERLIDLSTYMREDAKQAFEIITKVTFALVLSLSATLVVFLGITVMAAQTAGIGIDGAF